MSSFIERTLDKLKKANVEPTYVSPLSISGNVISVKSIPNSMGATNFINILSRYFSDMGKTVAVIDLNSKCRNRALCDKVLYSINDYLKINNSSVNNFLNNTKFKNVKYIGVKDTESIYETLPLRYDQDFIQRRSVSIENMIIALQNIFDIVFIDCVDTLDINSYISLKYSNEILLLTEFSQKGLIALINELSLCSDSVKSKMNLIIVEKYNQIADVGSKVESLPIIGKLNFTKEMERNIQLGEIIQLDRSMSANSVEDAKLYIGYIDIINYLEKGVMKND